MFSSISVERVVIHKILKGAGHPPAYTECSDSIARLSTETTEALRISVWNAVLKSRQFFETGIEHTHKESFWFLAKAIPGSERQRFIDLSVAIAELAADAHSHRTPPGLLLVVDALIDKLPSVIVIKAELQSALKLNGSAVEILNDLFLSPAKDFYKIGILIHKNPKVQNENGYSCYVYDDQFNSQRHDLARYFYKEFLGFTTSKNDKLLTKNFFDEVKEFMDTNLQTHEDRKTLVNALKADYRHSSDELLDPASYLKFFPEGSPLSNKFEKEILGNFPFPFTKDLLLVDNSLKKSSISIANGIKLVGDATAVDSRVSILNPDSDGQLSKKLQAEIDAGRLATIITISTLPQITDEDS